MLVTNFRSIQNQDQFLTKASHELRTPLTPLKLRLQQMQRMLAKNKSIPPAFLRQNVESCNRQILLLEAHIDELLEILRKNDGDQNLKN